MLHVRAADRERITYTVFEKWLISVGNSVLMVYYAACLRLFLVPNIISLSQCLCHKNNEHLAYLVILKTTLHLLCSCFPLKK